ncbi:hypothetical protein MHB71_04925 [Paenibacillus sp. FSL H7-0940]|uniref:hypothetical protein n=1 Tax=Paenibacillus sp. FSL H7-0940 TaxID=2921443 RepID=UPI0030EBFA06
MSNATQYREVRRKANAGERIKIVAADQAFGYSNGDIFTVTDANRWKVAGSGQAVSVAGVGIAIYHREYVVLEPIVASAPVSVNLPDLFAQFIRDNAPAVRSYLAEIDPVDSAEPLADVFEIKTPQLARAKVIEMARERVAELARIGRDDDARLEGSPLRGTWYEIDYVVNRDKRAVTALVYRLNGFTYTRERRKPNAVGIAKAAPDDVFNADIGKAIAAERALGLTVTEAFVNAPKPEKASAGAKVRKLTGHNIGCTMTLESRCTYCDGIGYGGNAFTTVEGGWVADTQYVVIDDTDAYYPQATFEPCEAV